MSRPQFRKRHADFYEARAAALQERGLDFSHKAPRHIDGYAGTLHIEAVQRGLRRRVKASGSAASSDDLRAFDARILDAIRSLPADDAPSSSLPSLSTEGVRGSAKQA